ncbi:hypothetical protein NDU88_001044 [Pleurodeles waltl]|uniref:Uncharacterized protein n=1 Tax=Pleurodeles waltl TaxID=8319 RepID=A0AAV7Q8M3_PLEWA|nr:hypothetical protein NDU88_001044 [Pleurodeles waltl]
MTSKAPRKQSLEGKPLIFQHSAKNQDATDPELQVLPMLVYLLIKEDGGDDHRSRTAPADSDGCTLGMGLRSDRVALAVHVAVLMVVQVAVSVAEMLPVLAVVQVTVVVDGDTIPSLAASDG